MRPADPRDSQTYAIIGAAMEIHRQRGSLINFGTASQQYKRLIWGYENVAIEQPTSSQVLSKDKSA